MYLLYHNPNPRFVIVFLTAALPLVINKGLLSEQNMEEDCFNSPASTSEQKMDLGSGSDKAEGAAVDGGVPSLSPASTLYTLNPDGSVLDSHTDWWTWCGCHHLKKT